MRLPPNRSLRRARSSEAFCRVSFVEPLRVAERICSAGDCSMAELSDEVHARVQALCEEGDAQAGAQRYAEALQRYWAAWDLLPDPKTEWDAATWLLGAIGDA